MIEKNAAGKNAVGKNAVGKNAVGKNAVGKDASEKNTVEKDAAGKITVKKNALEKNETGENAMKKVAVFAGTTEGRKIVEYLKTFPVEVYVSTATEYGKESLGDCRNAKVLCGRMDEKEMEVFLRKYGIRLAVDATHPFAREVTENLKNACRNCQAEYVRCLREAVCEWEPEDRECMIAAERERPERRPDVIRVDSVKEAVRFLKETEGTILIATGSKELKEYTQISDYRERCYARVLSTVPSVTECCRLGFEGKHLIAMQGPFSKEMNAALLHHVNAKYFVTKESGKEGGFPEKLQAASEAGAVLVVIGRPAENGKNLAEVMEYLAQWSR